MSDPIAEPPVPSPCIGVCDIHSVTGYCRGCFRTRREIADWRVLIPDQQRALLSMLAGRRTGVSGPGAVRARAWARRLSASVEPQDPK